MSNAEADYHFARGSYGVAAEKYANSNSRSFEEVTLKFVEKNAGDATMKYLRCKLNNVPRTVCTLLFVCVCVCLERVTGSGGYRVVRKRIHVVVHKFSQNKSNILVCLTLTYLQ